MVRILLSALAVGGSLLSFQPAVPTTVPSISATSEPGSLVLFGVSLLCVAILTRRLPRRG